MTSRIWIWALVLPLTLTPHPARSQCCTMPSGSGDDSRRGGQNSSERKAMRDIDRVLSRDESRPLLMEALLKDRDFTEAYIGRIAEDAEWRPVVQKRLDRASRNAGTAPEGRMSERQQKGGGDSYERKAKKDIGRLLSREESQDLLMEAVLKDRDFTEEFIGRIVEQPEWRAVAQRRLDRASKTAGTVPEGRMSDRKPEPNQAEERRFQVTVDGEGFHPASLTIPAGKPVTLVVTRTTDRTCAKEIVFPSLNETRGLPLDRPVEIRIPPQEKGSLTFACGMDMFRGRLVAQ